MAMVNIIRTVLGVIGNIISLCLFISPVPTFIKIWKWKSTRQYSGIPYVATLLNCMLWMFYGIPIVHPNSIAVLTINVIGTFLEVIFVTMFIIYSDRTTRLKMLKMLAALVVFFAAIVVVTLTLGHTHDERSLIVGLFCVVFGICMYASPLSVMSDVIQRRSVTYMPFYLSLASLSNAVIWTIYAFIHFDVFITIPNVLGALLGALQLILYLKYYRTTVWDDGEEVGEIEGPAGTQSGEEEGLKDDSGVTNPLLS